MASRPARAMAASGGDIFRKKKIEAARRPERADGL